MKKAPKLCDELGLQPTVFYRWQKQFFENGQSWGDLNGVCVPHDLRDQIVDFVRCWSSKTEIGVGRLIGWLGIAASK